MAGGVTSGIDMAIHVAAIIAGDEVAQQGQVQIEYDPEPPFKSGTPFVAPPAIVERALNATKGRRLIREQAVAQASAASRRSDTA